MGTLNQHRTLIKKILSDYAQAANKAPDGVETHLVFDEDRDHYMASCYHTENMCEKKADQAGYLSGSLKAKRIGKSSLRKCSKRSRPSWKRLRSQRSVR